jgi:hypothetical protein
MDFLFDIITFPFELIGGSIECMFSCAFIAVLACCITSFVLFVLAS